VERTKWCGSCQRKLPVSQWGSNRARWDGLSSQCRDCRHDYFNRNRERENLKRRQRWYEKYPTITAKSTTLAVAFALFSEESRRVLARWCLDREHDTTTRKAICTDAVDYYWLADYYPA